MRPTTHPISPIRRIELAPIHPRHRVQHKPRQMPSRNQSLTSGGNKND
jgi:hypothetical protein